MGLTTWKNTPQGRIRKSNVSIAKNYLSEEDILHDKGKVTAAIAKAFAESEFEKFRVLQDRTYQSDFDRLVANIEENIKQNKSGNPTHPDTVHTSYVLDRRNHPLHIHSWEKILLYQPTIWI